ncbi:MAG: F0F1 ATP synthase subunit epsilon, partial [Selenomonas sp.]|nr:F0F1 ATP synthase subunit epsilon [Selenomonas sp.]
AFHQGGDEARNIDIERAQLALRRAIARLRATGSEFDELK